MVAVNAYTGEKVWSAHVGSISSMPAVGYGKVYLSTSDTGDGGALVALDERTGVEQWRVPTEDSQGGSPVIDEGLVFIQSNNSKDEALYALDAQTGEERWTAKVSPEGMTDDDYFQSSTAAPSVRNGVVYAASGYGDLVAYTAAKGEVLWRFHVSQATYGTPVIFENTVFVSSFEVIGPPDTLERPPTQGNLYAVDTATGQERWSLPISSSDAQPAISDGVLYITGMDVAGDSIYALNAVNGDTIWRLREPDHHFTNVVAGGEVIYASTYEGKVFALNSGDGSVLWQVDTRKAVLGDPIGTNDSVVVSSADGAIFALGQDLSLATPVPPTSVIDVSGLPECQPYRTLPTIEMTGTPALTLIPGRWEEFQDTILVSEIPQDTSASEEAKAGIRETLARMEACENQLTSEPRGFFTDDFLRRPSAIWNPNSARYFGAHAVYADGGGPALRFDDAWTLPDGRVGIAIRYDFGENSYQRYGHGTFVIFTEQDGHWLIDESYRIVPELSNQG
jgi:eukaryotic-like serine/threonine-protein kinase